MFIRMNNLYGMKGQSAWYRKQGTGCFDFVNRKEFASDLTEQECKKIVEHASWYCSQYNAESIEIVNSDGRKEADRNTEHPEHCYSKDLYGNCIIIKWGESGYYKTDFPEGGYTDEIIDEMNSTGGISPKQRKAMEICSMNGPGLDWDKHYSMIMERTDKNGNKLEKR